MTADRVSEQLRVSQRVKGCDGQTLGSISEVWPEPASERRGARWARADRGRRRRRSYSVRVLRGDARRRRELLPPGDVRPGPLRRR